MSRRPRRAQLLVVAPALAALVLVATWAGGSLRGPVGFVRASLAASINLYRAPLPAGTDTALPATTVTMSPSARLAAAQRQVGPLFAHGAAGGHSCTASVVTSASGSVLLTAAHCVAGTAAGWLFAPGYDNGTAPQGYWTVTGAYVDASWSSAQDPQDDVAVLTVAPKTVDGHQVTVQQAVGSSPIGAAANAGVTITDVAYNADSDVPLVCTATVGSTDGYPTFDCDGFVGGSSGSPWLAADTDGVLSVRGVIGGLNQGGCSPDESYSSVFTPAIGALVERASDGSAADTVPPAGSSGC